LVVYRLKAAELKSKMGVMTDEQEGHCENPDTFPFFDGTANYY
jgi:hypothetical protein